MPQEEACLLEGRGRGKIVDIVAAVRQHTPIAVQVADARRCGGYAFKTRFDRGIGRHLAPRLQRLTHPGCSSTNEPHVGKTSAPVCR